jgi:hypothetical protein
VTRAQRAAVLACALLGAPAAACELILAEHRGGHELVRLPLDPAAPAAEIAFTHSVLGTPVTDRYEWRTSGGRWRAHLVEERFDGDGYGLPHAAGDGETLVRDGRGWRLRLDRVVDPLVVRPLPAQSMRVEVPGREPLPLGPLSKQAISLQLDCPDFRASGR